MEAPNDTPKLSRDTRILLYEEARKPVRVNRGTPYPCTEDDLDTCREQGSMCVSNNPPYVTTFQATAQLCDWLNLEREPTARSMSALMRLNHYMWKLSWGPDIVIKAFRDLDIAFFDSILMGRVTVEWLCRTDWARLPGTEDSFGKTRWRNHRQCRIMLNADAILLNMSISPEPFTRMWQVIAHEMCHAYLFIRCGLDESNFYWPHDPRTGTWAGSHGTPFRRIIHSVDRRMRKYLQVGVIVDGEDYRQHG